MLMLLDKSWRTDLANMFVSATAVFVLLLFGLTACQPTPPDHRPEVTLPVYAGGDVTAGQVAYQEYCEQCHKLQAGQNKKGPQLMNVYGSQAALLSDYKYSSAMTASGWQWDATTLDAYIADPDKALPSGRMLSDPIPDAKVRQDIIAYLSTLRQKPSNLETGIETGSETSPQNGSGS